MNHSPFKRGLLIKFGQLRSWVERVELRLSRVGTLNQISSPSGAKNLHSWAKRKIKEATQTLDRIPDYLQPWQDGDLEGLAKLHGRLSAAEQMIKLVDQQALPILASRTASDPKYDQFVGQFLNDLCITDKDGLEIAPITCHKQRGVPGLSIDHNTFRWPIFFFSPSIRSLDAMALLYHEIGHLFWTSVLEFEPQRGFKFAVLPLDSKWNSKPAANLSLEQAYKSFPAIAQMHEEIMADAFAGITGGFAYTNALCCLFLCKPGSNIYRIGSKYPPARWRVWFSRRAALVGGAPQEDDKGPLFEAWNSMMNLPFNGKSIDPLVYDDARVDAFLDTYKAALIEAGVPLAGECRRLMVNPVPSFDPRTAKVQEILLTAAKFKSDVGWQQYREWEQGLAPKLGLPRRESLRQKLRRTVSDFLRLGSK